MSVRSRLSASASVRSARGFASYRDGFGMTGRRLRSDRSRARRASQVPGCSRADFVGPTGSSSSPWWSWCTLCRARRFFTCVCALPSWASTRCMCAASTFRCSAKSTATRCLSIRPRASMALVTSVSCSGTTMPCLRWRSSSIWRAVARVCRSVMESSKVLALQPKTGPNPLRECCNESWTTKQCQEHKQCIISNSSGRYISRQEGLESFYSSSLYGTLASARSLFCPGYVPHRSSEL